MAAAVRRRFGLGGLAPLPDRPAAPRGLAAPRDPRGDRVASAVSRGVPSDAVSCLIDGPCAWRGPELRAAPELWTHRLTASEIAELDALAARAPPTWT